MGLTIKLADRAEIDALVKIEKGTFDAALYPLMSKRNFSHLLTHGHADIWLAWVDGQAVGDAVVFYRKNSSYARLYSIAVLPSHQGGLVGKALLEAAEAAAQKRGLKGMVQEIRADNERLFGRYLSLGYRETGRMADYYPDGCACIKLKRDFQ